MIVTEVTSPEAAFHYLYVVPDWPSSQKLDEGSAFELGAPGVAHVQGGEFYFYHGEPGIMERYEIGDDLTVQDGDTLSFASKGIKGFDPESIWVSDDLAFMLDEKSGQIARWNPSAMSIGDVEKFNADVLRRDDMNVQFQLGVAAAGRLFTTVNWRDWNTNTIHEGTVIGIFDEDSPADGPELLENDDCAPSVAVGAFADGGYIYQVGDATNGFDRVASPKPVTKPQCVVRMKQEADTLDDDFFLDLNAVIGSPAIFMAFPMKGHKLLVNHWATDVEIDDVADRSGGSAWFWDKPEYYDYSIIDLDAKTATKVEDLPRSAAQSPKLLRVDDINYVQIYRDDNGTDLWRVDPDGTATRVLRNATSTNVQYIGRL